jgi:oxygen-independent coproporphyrinogen-3 oxidase
VFKRLDVRSKNQIGLYIHIPFCKQKCYYCDFPSYPYMEEYWGAYTEALVSELVLKAEEYNGPDIGTIFIGGGTPSLIPSEYISRILETVYKHYKVSRDCEATIESNPGTLTDEKLKQYKESGINRLSIGLQACQDDILEKLGRIHTFKDFTFTLNLAQKHGFVDINADIIFSIPNQTLAQWKDTVSKVITFELTHISCYSMKIEEDTVFGRLKSAGQLEEIEDELDRDMYHYAADAFYKAGFYQYEISNFSKPHFRCRHNMNYWERGEYIGTGAGAHSFIRNRRFANTADVPEYIKGIREKKPVLSEDNCLSVDDGIKESMILGLRLKEGIDLAKLSRELGVDLENKYHKKLNKLLSQNLVEREGSVLRLTSKGMDLANMVWIEFI